MELSNKKQIIYRIFNTESGKSYIGKTVRTFFQRYGNSKYWWRKIESPILKNAIEKYGVQKFSVEILENDVHIDLLSSRERFYANKFRSYSPNGYNIAECGDGGYSVVKDYIFFDLKKNIKISIHNLMDFCRNNNLSYSCMIRVHQGKTNKHKNFANSKFTSIQEIQNKKTKSLEKQFEFKSPSGTLVKIVNLRKFCRENALCHVSMRKLSKNLIRQGHHKGWMSSTSIKQEIDKYDNQNLTLKYKGLEIVIKNMSKFCRENGLNRRKMDALKYKRILEYNGYTI